VRAQLAHHRERAPLIGDRSWPARAALEEEQQTTADDREACDHERDEHRVGRLGVASLDTAGEHARCADRVHHTRSRRSIGSSFRCPRRTPIAY
jgi:hypothetical protein